MKRRMIKCKRNKAFLGAIIGAVGSIASSVAGAVQQKKAAKKQLAEQVRQAGVEQAANMTAAYSDQNYVDEYKKKITLRNGGVIKHTSKVNNTDNKEYKFDRLHKVRYGTKVVKRNCK